MKTKEIMKNQKAGTPKYANIDCSKIRLTIALTLKYIARTKKVMA